MADMMNASKLSSSPSSNPSSSPSSNPSSSSSDGSVDLTSITKDNELPDCVLTTRDNPFNPFFQWDEWWTFDTQHGYNTSSLLARLTRTADELSELDNDLAIDDAQNEILFLNPTGNYIKVTKENFNDMIKPVGGGSK